MDELTSILIGGGQHFGGPASQELTKAMRNFIDGFITKGSETFLHNMTLFWEKYKRIPDKNKIQPPTEMLSRILDVFRYVENDTLRDLFAELLKSSSDSEKIEIAHPSFVSVISSLSVDEAIILTFLNKNNNLYLLFVSYNNENAAPGRYYKNGKSTTIAEINLDLDFPKMMDFYIDNMVQLGLLHPSIKIDDNPPLQKKYENYYITLRDEHIKKNIEHLDLPDIVEAYFGLTEYAELFMKACISEEEGKGK